MNRELWALGKIMNSMEGGGDRDRSFPQSDVDDLEHGARYIPGEVTLARRTGQKVEYRIDLQEWVMPNGEIIK